MIYGADEKYAEVALLCTIRPCNSIEWILADQSGEVHHGWRAALEKKMK